MRWMWIDRVVELVPRRRMVAIKNISLSEEHLQEHFRAVEGRAALPIMPASLIVEGMAQTGGLLIGHAEGFREKVVLAKVTRAEFLREAAPGYTLRYTATIERMDPQGTATVGVVELLDPAGARPPEEIARIDLIFSHLDQSGSAGEVPTHNFVFGDSFRTLLRTSGIEV